MRGSGAPAGRRDCAARGWLAPAGGRPRGALRLLLCAALAAGCDSPTIPARADAYPFALPGSGLVFHWEPGTRVRVHVAAEPAGRAQVLADAFDAAAAAWAVTAPLAEVTLARTASASAADVVLAWSDGPFPVQTAACPPTGGGGGATTFCLTAESDAFVPYPPSGGGDGDVLFLVTISPTLAEDPVVMRRLVTHEIGHALGLFQHSPNADDLMFGGSLVADAPTEADRATFFTLYHTPSDLAGR